MEVANTLFFLMNAAKLGGDRVDAPLLEVYVP